jgi:hypothetical protein
LRASIDATIAGRKGAETSDGCSAVNGMAGREFRYVKAIALREA